MICQYCQSMIDNDRLEFLKEYNRSMVCKDCSTEQRAVGFMNYSHKTAPDIVLCPANAKEALRILHRANRRAR